MKPNVTANVSAETSEVSAGKESCLNMGDKTDCDTDNSQNEKQVGRDGREGLPGPERSGQL